MSKELDRAYIKRVLSGDHNAFRYFIKQYQETAIRIAFSMVQEESMAKHIVQNAFIQAFKSLKGFKQESKFSTWLYRIVVNESIKINRKSKQQQKTVPISMDNTKNLQTHSSALNNIQTNEKREQINQVLALMKPKERLMLELFYLQEYSVMEIRVITGFSKSNIKVLLHRARKSFAAYYASTN